MKSSKKTKRKMAKVIGFTKFGGMIIDEPNKYDNDPYFLKKAAEAKAYLEKVGLPPKELMERNS
jgi:hypothetical protein